MGISTPQVHLGKKYPNTVRKSCVYTGEFWTQTVFLMTNIILSSFCVAVEREVVQKRTFTRWINLHLEKVRVSSSGGCIKPPSKCIPGSRLCVCSLSPCFFFSHTISLSFFSGWPCSKSLTSSHICPQSTCKVPFTSCVQYIQPVLTQVQPYQSYY